jgi:hypothetical protein
VIPPRTYATPLAFKTAIERRLMDRAKALGLEVNRQRQLFVFDRYLARLATVFKDTMVLKGGLAIELRLDRARTTKDIDLRMVGDPDALLERLQEAGRLDLGDYLAFEVQADPDHPDIDAEGMQYQGLRFRADARMAGRRYGGPFGLDVAFAEPLYGQPEILTGAPFLDFVGIPPVTVAVYPLETHVAEKLHAYTVPRKRPNSRVKDLPDIALLATSREIDAEGLRLAIRRTFDHRATHAVPLAVPEPPESWGPVYARIADEDGLRWRTLDEALGAVRAFLDPVLRGDSGGWNPSAWVWK